MKNTFCRDEEKTQTKKGKAHSKTLKTNKNEAGTGIKTEKPQVHIQLHVHVQYSGELPMERMTS